ncbi:hypothetical protein EOM09_03100 [bacterium]|nr:hypothetical protein [bacterium]
MGTRTKTNSNKKGDFVSPQMLIENIMHLRHDFNMLALSSYAAQELMLEKELITKDELEKKVQEIYEKSQKQMDESDETSTEEIGDEEIGDEEYQELVEETSEKTE